MGGRVILVFCKKIDCMHMEGKSDYQCYAALEPDTERWLKVHLCILIHFICVLCTLNVCVFACWADLVGVLVPDAHSSSPSLTFLSHRSALCTLHLILQLSDSGCFQAASHFCSFLQTFWF